MKNETNFVTEHTKLVEKAKIDTNAKYLTAKQIEVVFGIPQKTVLNRSNLPNSHPRFIPSVKLNKSGRKKYFERKVIDRMFQIGRVS